MAGKTQGDFAKQQLEKIDSVLDEYESSLGLSKFQEDLYDGMA